MMNLGVAIGVGFLWPASSPILTVPDTSKFEDTAKFYAEAMMDQTLSSNQQRPNVIMVVHESLSGGPFHTQRGREAMPFFFSKMKNNPNVYQFSNGKAVAGVTSTATPALLSGLLPFEEECRDLVFSSSTASEWKAMGYSTGSFVSYGADWSGTSWYPLNTFLVNDFDYVVEPKSVHEEPVNEYGMDDRTLVKYFQEWVGSLEDVSSKPFFALIVMNNNHFPHLTHSTFTGGVEADRYFSSLTTTDESMEMLFSGLENAGILENTVLVGAGDHGEAPGSLYKRIGLLDANIVSVPVWMHMPQSILPDRAYAPTESADADSGGGGRQRPTYLETNLHKSVTVIDLIPTLRDLMGRSRLYSDSHKSKCILGASLLSSTLPDGRLVAGYHGKPMEEYEQMAFLANENKTMLYFDNENLGESKIIEHTFHEIHPFELFMEIYLKDLDRTVRSEWLDELKHQDWLNSSFVSLRMPKIQELLNQ